MSLVLKSIPVSVQSLLPTYLKLRKAQVCWALGSLFMFIASLPHLRKIFPESGCPWNRRGANLLQDPESRVDGTVPPCQFAVLYL